MIKRCKRVLAAAMAPALLMGSVAAVATPLVQASSAEDYKASYIQKTDDFASDYHKYLNSSVMFQLPESVKADDEISVIVKTGEADLMSVYNRSNKTMSFSQYATQSDDAAKLRDAVASDKAKVLAALDEKKVTYETGEEYAAVLSGFELVIKARDFEAVRDALGEGMDVIVGEEYAPAETELVENTVNVFDTGIFDSSD